MLAVASATDSDVTFVAASQMIRLVLMLISAPVIVWAMGRWVRHRAVLLHLATNPQRAVQQWTVTADPHPCSVLPQPGDDGLGPQALAC